MHRYDIYGIGNALVDMEFRVDDSTLREIGIAKGMMTLVDAERQAELRSILAEACVNRASGGSAANTCIALTGLGGKAFYSCRVAGDETGRYFVDDLNAAGVASNPHDGDAEGVSGTCLVMVTPDAERTMTTCLAISEELGEAQLDLDALGASKYLYLEGYLASSASGSAAASKARAHAEEFGIATSLTLSDASMVEFFKDPLTAMLGNGVEVLFCNEAEALLWARSDRLDIAERELADIGRVVCITLGARGSVVLRGRQRHLVPGFEVDAVDTVGAGDTWAGSYLYGITHGMEPTAAASLANFTAARLVTEFGARLPAELYARLRDAHRDGVTSPLAVQDS